MTRASIDPTSTRQRTKVGLATLGVLAAICVLSSVVGGLLVSPAVACSLANPRLVYASSAVPVDGVLVLRWDCNGLEPCPNPWQLQALEVREAASARAVLGAVELQGKDDAGNTWMRWRPSTPFVAGTAYEVENTMSDWVVGERFVFAAVEALPFDPNELSPEATLTLAIAPVEATRICCGGRGPCGGELGCVWTHEIHRARLSIDFASAMQGADQWLYRTSFFTQGGVPVSSELRTVTAAHHVFDEVASEYCYTLEAEHPVTRQVVKLGGCRTNDLTLGERASTSHHTWALQSCTVPPTGFEAAWCAATAEHDCTEVEIPACAERMKYCGAPAPGQTEPPVDDAAPRLPGGDPGSAMAQHDEVSGCSVRSGTPSAGAGLGTLVGALSVLGAAVLSRRARDVRR